MRVKEYAYAEDIAFFNQEVRKAAASPLPEWHDGHLAGSYFLVVDDQVQGVKPSITLASWEQIATQLTRRNEFMEETAFYMIHGMRQVGTTANLPYGDSGYLLESGQSYDLSIYHYSPTSLPKSGAIAFVPSSGAVQVVSGGVAEFDTRYDMKRVRVRSAVDVPTDESCSIALYRTGKDAGTKVFDFDLGMVVRTNWSRTVVYGVGIGILIAAPQVVAAILNTQLSPRRLVVAVVSYVVFGLAAGIAASLGIRRKV